MCIYVCILISSVHLLTSLEAYSDLQPSLTLVLKRLYHILHPSFANSPIPQHATGSENSHILESLLRLLGLLISNGTTILSNLIMKLLSEYGLFPLLLNLIVDPCFSGAVTPNNSDNPNNLDFLITTL